MNRDALQKSLDDMSLAVAGTPGLANWRETRFREVRDYAREIDVLSLELLRAPGFSLLLQLCVLTRFFWSRLHAAGFARTVPRELDESCRIFIRTVELVQSRKDIILAACTGTNGERARRYMGSMDLRLRLVVDWIEKGSDSLFAKLEEEGAVEDRTVLSQPSSASPRECCPGLSLLCGAYWLLASKLLSWTVELRREAGPHALSIKDHRDLCTGFLQLFRLLLDAAESVGPLYKEEIDKARQLRLDMVTQIKRPLGVKWKAIQRARGFSDDAGFHDSDLDHPMEAEMKCYLSPTPGGAGDTLPDLVHKYTRAACSEWKSIRARISAGDWSNWIRLSFSKEFLLELPRSSPQAAVGEWQVFLCHVLEKLDEVKDADSLDGLLAVVVEHRLSTDDRTDSAAVVNALLDRLLELDFMLAAPRVETCLLQPCASPHGFYEIQLVGSVMRAAAKAVPRPAVVPFLHDLIHKITQVAPEIYGGIANRNTVVSGLLAGYLQICDADVAGIRTLNALFTHCENAAGEEDDARYFLQSIADDATEILPDRPSGENTPKLTVLASFVSRERIRWNDTAILEKLDAILQRG